MHTHSESWTSRSLKSILKATDSPAIAFQFLFYILFFPFMPVVFCNLTSRRFFVQVWQIQVFHVPHCHGIPFFLLLHFCSVMLQFDNLSTYFYFKFPNLVLVFDFYVSYVGVSKDQAHSSTRFFQTFTSFLR